MMNTSETETSSVPESSEPEVSSEAESLGLQRDLTEKWALASAQSASSIEEELPFDKLGYRLLRNIKKHYGIRCQSVCKAALIEMLLNRFKEIDLDESRVVCHIVVLDRPPNPSLPSAVILLVNSSPPSPALAVLFPSYWNRTSAGHAQSHPACDAILLISIRVARDDSKIIVESNSAFFFSSNLAAHDHRATPSCLAMACQGGHASRVMECITRQ
ncbi:hypothetical protein PAPYR_13361 [Paratrimastix pyriformis]|uniref:Uncharacterized protein n=1 Tax=Paratrimastix pyriformis TaxID=342808 RepID=A0ABQ8U3W9_9EUKA|nr:hypothetical protein PAPYR_13361 [Paratrimastix pyriformis]